MVGTRDVVTTFSKIYQKPSSGQDDVPEVTVQDILSGRSTRKGDLSAVPWVSTVPPYYTFLASCQAACRSLADSQVLYGHQEAPAACQGVMD